jgi:hypothetical protein
MHRRQLMNSKLTLCGKPAALACAVLALASTTQAAVILDNTSDGTNPLGTSLGSITVNNYTAKVFTTPATGNWSLDGLKMALYSSSGNVSRTVFAELMAVNGSNNPTGSPLVSESFVLNLTSTPLYYDLDLTAEDWGLDSNTTYALVLRSDAPSATTSWTQPPSNNTYSMSQDFTFVGTRRSTDGGTSWGVNSYNNGLQILATVPEPTTVSTVVACGLLGLGAWRRRRTA